MTLSTIGAVPRRRIGASCAFKNLCGALCTATRRYASPSQSNIEPNVAPQMRLALSSIASNTSLSSPGELLMTFSTSEVAVCCSSDSRNSLSNRAFSMAITACAAKFCTTSICFIGERPHLLAVDDD